MAPREKHATTSNSSDSVRNSPEGSNNKQPKNRPSPSCIPCRRRKVKCDRTKPCRACCSKGTPEACQYNTNSEDRFYISQAEIIDRLRNEVNNLRKKLAILEDETESDFSVTESESDSASSENPTVIQVAVRGSSARRTGTKYTALERMYTLLASAPLNLVEDAVIQIRGGASVEAVAARVTSVDYAIIRGHSV